MPRKQITQFDVLNALSEGLRQRASIVGFNKYEPMHKQIEFHLTDTQGRIFSGGNRAGKTVASVTESVAWLTGRHPLFSERFPPPIRGRHVAVDFDRGVNLILVPEYKKWIEPAYLINGKWDDSYHKATKLLTLKNGSTIEFMSYDQEPDSFAGTSRHFVAFDEEPPQNIFTECLARLIDTDGRWWIALTPLIEFSWTADTLYEPIREGELPFITLFESDTKENVHIRAGAVDELMFVMAEDEREARQTGSGYGTSQLIYPEMPENVINVTDEQFQGMKKDWTWFTCMDHGLRNPTAILYCAVGPDGDIIVYDEYYHSNRLVGENAELYKYHLKKLGVAPDYMVADPSTQNTDPITGTSIRVEYGEHDVWYMLGNNDVHAGILRVKSLMKHGYLKINVRCQNLLKEARLYKWAKPISAKIAARQNLMELPVKRNDHAMDALRYGVMSLPKTKEELDEERYRMINELIPTARTAEYFEYDKADVEGYIDEHLGAL